MPRRTILRTFPVRFLIPATMVCAVILSTEVFARRARAQERRKDYLTQTESDKIRDAYQPETIKLFILLTDDRLKKFQYELSRKTPEGRRSEIWTDCSTHIKVVWTMRDQIDLAREKQADIRPALKTMDTKTKEFMTVLQKLHEGGPEYHMYKDTLDDALEGTQDAINDVAEAQKELTPVPMRRKPN